MYTNPADARHGVGRQILSLCEAAAAAEGFTRLELMSTLSGEPLNTAYGFQPLERLADATGGSPCRSSGWRSPSTRVCSAHTPRCG